MSGSRLAAPEQEGPHQPGQAVGGLGVAVALDRHGDLRAGSRRAVPSRPGRGPVEDRPQLGEPVLDRRAGEGDAGAGRAAWRSARAVRGERVLDVLGLVGDHQAPVDGGRAPARSRAHHAVGGQDDLVGGERRRGGGRRRGSGAPGRRGRSGAAPAPSCRAARPGRPRASGRGGGGWPGGGRSPGRSCPGPCRRRGSRPGRARPSRPARPGRGAGRGAASAHRPAGARRRRAAAAQRAAGARRARRAALRRGARPRLAVDLAGSPPRAAASASVGA